MKAFDQRITHDIAKFAQMLSHLNLHLSQPCIDLAVRLGEGGTKINYRVVLPKLRRIRSK
jgi:hypothetical protein